MSDGVAELLPAPGGAKMCCVCGIFKPATNFYYHKDPYSSDGWCPKCKECRKKDRQKDLTDKVAKNIEQIETGLLKHIAAGNIRAPMCDVVSGGEMVLQAFGGMEGLAMKLAADYESSQIGSAARTKLLLGALMFVAKGMEKQQPIDFGTMSDEELQESLAKALGMHGRITEEPEAPRPVEGSEQE